MKRLAVLVCALVISGVGQLSAEPLTKAERERLADHLKKTEKALKDSTKGLSPAQWTFKQAADRWSVAECVEHLALSEDALFSLVTDRVMKSPAAPEKKDAATQKSKEEMILRVIPDRSRRVQAAEQLRPTGRWGSGKEAWKHFATSRKRTIDYVKKTQDDLRSHFLNNPVIKEMDAYEWLLFASAHTERHTKQILEVKADPNFAKR